MTRIVRLDEHVSRVQSSVLELLDSPNCNLLLLSDVQVAVLEQMTFPYVLWQTRLVEDHEQYQLTVDFPQAYTDELECLELLLSGGNTMSCDLSTVLTALADAIRNQPAGAGGCNYSGSTAVLNCIPGMSPAELIPQTPVDAPQYGVPPTGFDTWQEYLVHKCKAAWAIYDTVYGLFGALAGLPILQVTVTLVGTVLGGYVAATAFGAAAFPPAAIVAIAALALTIGILDAEAYVQFRQIQSYLEAHKDTIVCGLYTSGSAAEALEGLAAEVEDAIQSVEWSVIFGGVIGPELAAAVGAMAGEAETNNLVNPLFQVVEDFAYPDVDCSSCGGQTARAWHFDIDVEGWSFSVVGNEGDVLTAGWSDDFAPEDPGDSSLGLLWGQIDEITPPLGNCYVYWDYVFPEESRPEVQLGDYLSFDAYADQADHTDFHAYIYYTDATVSSGYWPNVAGWITHTVAGIDGKTIDHFSIEMGLGVEDAPVKFAIDCVIWGQ
jgi:hypothetical protein